MICLKSSFKITKNQPQINYTQFNKFVMVTKLLSP